MRCEVPEDVDVGLHQAEVDPDRVDELDVAYFSAADELADALNGRGVAVRVIAHEHQARAEGERGQLLSLGGGRGQRLLDQYVLAGLQGAAHKIEVGRGGCRDGHRGDGRVAEDRIVGVGGPDGGVRTEDGPGPFDLRDRTASPAGTPAWPVRYGRDSAPSSQRRLSPARSTCEVPSSWASCREYIYVNATRAR